MKVTEAIILAGGLGTRLRSVVPDLPKCMATINGKPFIDYVIEYLLTQGIEKFIFCVGYKHEVIVEHLKSFQSSLITHHSPLTTHYSIEAEPLGTGGAIKKGCSVAKEENVLVVNGDTLFKLDVMKLFEFHFSNNADCTLALKPMKNIDRYGVVELNNDHSVKDFKEKKYYTEGLINGGVYVLNKNNFLEEALPAKFSFEKDYLEKFCRQKKMYGFIQDAYFIDMGVPEDYARAQTELTSED